MTGRRVSEGTSFLAAADDLLQPRGWSPRRSSLSCITSALGPMITLPCTVPATRMPLPAAEGVGKKQGFDFDFGFIQHVIFPARGVES